ncbi:EamA family transporter [Natrinema gelatinilyticum]|uniref:EamA family transporter n=1 Tax=Natrinema gelatinilyticum TaxID=2961571 RepID=UPI0020C22148|nr:EamA family transporter [Natrinema gelatinilyticum]
MFRLLYFRGIEEVGASVAAAIMAMNPLVVMTVAVPLLEETVTLATGVGVLCIVDGGVVLQTDQNTDDDADVDVIARRLARALPRDLAYPLGAMVFIGIF